MIVWLQHHHRSYVRYLHDFFAEQSLYNVTCDFMRVFLSSILQVYENSPSKRLMEFYVLVSYSKI